MCDWLVGRGVGLGFVGWWMGWDGVGWGGWMDGWNWLWYGLS